MSRTIFRAAAISFIIVCIGASLAMAQQGGTTRYVYDNNGRLRAVISPNGETALYEYDAAGNITTIIRQGAASVSLLDFTPRSGPAGASVTIHGSGFGATAGANTVKFNGVTAEVISADATQIIARVPAGATTGTITVTTPSGAATSSLPFTVTESPVITGFTPIAGAAGTVVNITGSRFEPSIYDNRVSFNGLAAEVTAATATSITAIAPLFVTTGPISVTTPAGVTVSSNDFYVAPSSINLAEVEYADHIAFGQTKTVTINTPNKTGLLVFRGTAGQRVSLPMTSVTINNSDVKFLGLTGETLRSTFVTPPSGFSGVLTLPATGTYAILIDPRGADTGSMMVTLHDVPPDIAGAIVVDGPPVSVAITTPGQVARLTFNGVAGQRLRLAMSGVTIPAGNIQLFKPGSSTPIQTALVNAGPDSSIELLPLPTTGQYTILVAPSGANTGGITLTLTNLPSACDGSIAIGGSPVTATITAAGQVCRLTFSGAAGHRLVLEQLGGTLTNPRIIVLDPNGVELREERRGFVVRRDVRLLPIAGTYTIQVGSSGSFVGALTLVLYELPPDVLGTITPDGPPVTVTIPTSRQEAKLTFNGTAGQKVSLKMSGATLFTSVEIDDPAGNFLNVGDAESDGPVTIIDTTILPATGTYTILVEPSGGDTGSVTLTLYNVPAAVTATITPDGPAVTITTIVPGQDARLTFDGVAGQRVSLDAFNSTLLPSVRVSINKPDGTELVRFFTNFQLGVFAGALTLPVSGTYTIVVNPELGDVGSITLALYNVPADIAGAITIGGPPVTVTTTAPGQDARLTFSGTAGQQISLKMTGSITSGISLSISRPTGSNLVSLGPGLLQIGPTGVGSMYVTPTILPVAGTYTILAHPGRMAGSLSFTLYGAPADVNGGVITAGGAPVTITATAPRQDVQLTFSGTAGQPMNLRVSGATIPYRVLINNPDGSSLLSSTGLNLIERYINITSLPATGTYTIKVELLGDSGSLTLTLNTGLATSTGPITLSGPPATLTIPTAGQYGQLTFQGSANQRISLKYADVTFESGFLEILDPNGQSVTFPDPFDHQVNAGDVGASRLIEGLILPTTGTYTIRMRSVPGTGAMTITLYDVPADIAGVIIPDGAAVNVTTVPGQNAKLTFSGVTGQAIKLRVTGSTIGKVAVRITKPWGASLTSFLMSDSNFELPLQILPSPGTYTIEIDPQLANTGSLSVRVTSQ